MDQQHIGQKLRERRVGAGIGLRELGRLANISAASLIAIEKGASSPTLATLTKVLKALGSGLTEFFAQSPGLEETPVFASKNMKRGSDEHREYLFLFPKQPDLRFEMMHETIQPTEQESEWEQHDCDMGGTILSGGPAQLEIEGQGQWTLRKGDAFYVKAQTH